MRTERMRRAALSTTLLLFVTAGAHAQSIGRIVVRDVTNSVGDAWAILTSPLHGRPSDWLLAGAAFGVSAAVSPWVMPSRRQKPRSIRPTVRPAIVTDAADTRCRTMRIRQS